VNLAWVLRRLDRVSKHRGYFTARCPAHDDGSPSLSVREGQRGQALLKCFAGCKPVAIQEALRGHGPLRDVDPVQVRVRETNQRELAAAARRIWTEARLADGTLVDRYLRGRGLTLELPLTLRFHPELKHPSGMWIPAMVASVVDVDGILIGVQRTFLDPNRAAKAQVEPARMSLGPCAGGAVRLAEAEDHLILAEGIETGLAVLQATGRPTWATLGTSGLRRVELPSKIREVTIAADSDSAGLEAACHLARRLKREGRTVRIAKPDRDDSDMNDLLQQKENSNEYK
jgi:putative DNA primase/helicase